MKLCRRIIFPSNNQRHTLMVGRPDRREELNRMFRLRYDVYLKKGYIFKEDYSDGLEIDELDKFNKCVYWIASIDEKIIGSVRLIQDEFLPTEKECFKFIEPDIIKNIPRTKRAEIGRLIAINHPYIEAVPPHLTIMSIFSCVLEYMLQKDIIGGYAFIKESLYNKLRIIKFPFHLIKPAEQIYSQRVLQKYFNNISDPVAPIYYFADEVRVYLDRYFSKIFFNRASDTFFYKKNPLSIWELFKLNIFVNKK